MQADSIVQIEEEIDVCIDIQEEVQEQIEIEEDWGDCYISFYFY